MEKLISIIVPIYNTNELLLEKCVTSILSQTYKKLEIILVDDGSKQPTVELCDKIAQSDSRIKVIHKQNGGLSSARNAGLDIASGDFISFVDSDDYLALEAIERMVDAQSIVSAPIVCMKNIVITDSGNILHHYGEDSGNIDFISWQEYIDGICRKRLSESVCDKLFDSKLFHGRRFESGRLNEDFLFLSKMLLDKLDVAIIDYAGYYYLKHPGTITSNRSEYTSLKDAIRNSDELAELTKDQSSNVFMSFVYSTLFQIRVLFSLLPVSMIGSHEWQTYTTIAHKYYNLRKKCGLKMVDGMLLEGLLLFPRLTRTICRLVKH